MSYAPGTQRYAIGTWQSRWNDLLAALRRLEEAYDVQPDGRSLGQLDANTFLLHVDLLVDWVAPEIADTPAQLRARIAALDEPWLAIGCDLAVGLRHRDRSWHRADDPELAIVRREMADFVDPRLTDYGLPLGTANVWTIRYTLSSGEPISVDLLDLAYAAVGQWSCLLRDVGLDVPTEPPPRRDRRKFWPRRRAVATS